MANSTQTNPASTKSLGLPASEWLDHWQGHRRLTRRTILAFPDDKLFTYSVGGMRPFAELVVEFLGMGVPGLTGMATGKWPSWEDAETKQKPKPTNKKELLEQWDEATEKINELWPQLTPERFMENDTAFGMWPGSVNSFLFYFIENEIHHRGQAYVYLRSLGIAPPSFPDRS